MPLYALLFSSMVTPLVSVSSPAETAAVAGTHRFRVLPLLAQLQAFGGRVQRALRGGEGDLERHAELALTEELFALLPDRLDDQLHIAGRGNGRWAREAQSV